MRETAYNIIEPHRFETLLRLWPLLSILEFLFSEFRRCGCPLPIHLSLHPPPPPPPFTRLPFLPRNLYLPQFPLIYLCPGGSTVYSFVGTLVPIKSCPLQSCSRDKKKNSTKFVRTTTTTTRNGRRDNGGVVSRSERRDRLVTNS